MATSTAKAKKFYSEQNSIIELFEGVEAQKSDKSDEEKGNEGGEEEEGMEKLAPQGTKFITYRLFIRGGWEQDFCENRYLH